MRIKHGHLDRKMSVGEIMKFYSTCAFQAGKLAKAADILENMVKDKKSVNYLALAGALVPAGLRGVLVDMVRDGWIDVVVSTGANMTHDLQIGLGGEKYFHHTGELDDELRSTHTSRFYDIVSPDESGVVFEKKIQTILQDVHRDFDRPISSAELMRQIGRRLDDKESFIRACYEKEIPIFVPAIDDSILGFQTWMFWQEKKLVVDSMRNLQEIIDFAFDVRSSGKNSGLLILGGGVPKNYAMHAALFSGQPHKRAIQITLDRPDTGGLSGATLEEAVSWGKLTKKSEMVTVTSEVTIALPLLCAAVKERI